MSKSFLFAAALAACTGSSVEDNSLGIVRLETHQSTIEGVSVFELRAIDDAGDVVASVKRRTGTIAGLGADVGSGDDRGSEIIINVGPARARGVSHATGMFMLPPANPDFRHFLELPSVATALQREGSIHVYTRVAGAPTGEVSYGTQQCPGSKLVNNGVVAEQCCYATASAWQRGHTLFKRGGMNRQLYREEGSPCTDYSGSYLCRFAGGNCVFGPNGFTVASTWDYSNYLRIVPNELTCNDEGCYGPPSGTVCVSEIWNVPPSPVFGNVTGTFPMSSCGAEPNYIWSY